MGPEGQADQPADGGDEHRAGCRDDGCPVHVHRSSMTTRQANGHRLPRTILNTAVADGVIPVDRVTYRHVHDMAPQCLISSSSSHPSMPLGDVVIPVLGWLVGAVLPWSSTAKDKLLASVPVPGGLLKPLLLVGLGAGTSTSAGRAHAARRVA